MRLFLKQNKHFLLLSLIFLIAEIIVNPLGEFPLIDDWSFTQSVQQFAKKGEIFIGNFPSMSLCTQILWGHFMTKLLGFSFFTLRFSTILSTLISLAFFNKLVLQISGNRNIAFFACIVLLFNPLIFNLTNTFMTDVNFNTLAILCCYFMYNFFRTQRLVHYIFFIVFSVFMVLLRQYGIIFPACFVVACFFVKDKKARAVALAVLALVLVTGALKLYENYLKETLPPDSTYKFSENTHLFERSFWDTFFATFKIRYKEILTHALMWPVPFALVFLVKGVRRFRIWVVLLVLLVDAILIYALFNSEGVRSDSLFDRMTLGNETFYETTQGNRHNSYDWFNSLMMCLRWLFPLITLFSISLAAINSEVRQKWKHILKPEIIFLVLLLFAYAFMILITESYFDRYHIPFVTFMILLMAYISKLYAPDFKLALIPLIFFAYISVFGTKDYMALNRQKWRAYWYLRHTLHVPKEQINGGGEINCYNEGEGLGFHDFLHLNFNYLIQFDPEENFRPYREYEFQRYLPYKKDKIYIFVRHDEKNSKHDQ